jgi:serine/threonine protein kinase, bacterial
MSLSFYPIIRQLNNGALGKTFLATNTLMPSHPYCVIKQLIPASSDLDSLLLVQERFKKEGLILENLGKQSNGMIPRLYAYFVEDGEFYFVHEYINGETLLNHVKNRGVFTELQVRQLLQDILPTLNYVHHQNVVHRDLQPKNIILRAETNRPVLTDFGAVKEVMGTTRSLSGNTARSIVGNPGFVPAEQMSGRPMFVSDIYALGLTIIYLLTGKMPDEMESDPATGKVEWKIHAPNVSPQLTQVLNTATHPIASNRYGSAKDILTALGMSTPTEDFHRSPAATIVASAPSNYSNPSPVTAVAPIQESYSTVPVSSPPQYFSVEPTGLQSRTSWLWPAVIWVIAGVLLIAAGLFLSKNFMEPAKNISDTDTNAVVTKRPTPQTSSAPARVSPDVAVIKHYQLIQNQQLDQSWTDLSTSFQGSNLTQGFQEYRTWWNSVDRIDIGKVETVDQSTDSAIVQADLSYRLKSGRVMSDQKKYIYLVWDNDKWLINGKSETFKN